jgi:hypothetical protein
VCVLFILFFLRTSVFMPLSYLGRRGFLLLPIFLSLLFTLTFLMLMFALIHSVHSAMFGLHRPVQYKISHNNQLINIIIIGPSYMQRSALSHMSFASPLKGIALPSASSSPSTSSLSSASNPAHASAHAAAALKENRHLRRLLAERDVLCSTLKTSLEQAARAQVESNAETQRLRQRIATLVAGRARHIIDAAPEESRELASGADPDELPMPTREEEMAERRRLRWEDEERSGDHSNADDSSILSVWSQVLFGE